MNLREITLTNTMSRKRESLQTLKPGVLTMYSCGPTVYGLIHIGNLRSALVADMLFRYFKRVGYEVTYVRNYTDIDDRILQKAAAENRPWTDVTRHFTEEVEKDYAVSGVLEPTHKTRATDHVSQMIELIEVLIKKGHAYIAGGDVLFSIDQDKDYGKLSHRSREDMEAGARIDINSAKKNPLDFTLWKAAKPGEPSWPSPWGSGRPGWHIECSAMARRWLGDRIDVHHGGEDLIFPHHENEIAQSECATGNAPFARYWVHHAFLQISKQKMSKSLGNVFTAREFLTRFSGEFARAFLLGVHYRTLLDFGIEALEQTLTVLARIYEAKKLAESLRNLKRALPDLRAENAWGEFVAECQKTKTRIDEHFAQDFNTPAVLADLLTLVRNFNRVAAERRAQATPAAVLGAQELIRMIEDDVGGVLGFGLLSGEKGLEEVNRIRSEIRTLEGAAARPLEEEILALIEERKQARSDRDFARADAIRKDLEARGVILKDAPNGTTWRYS